MIYPTIEFYHKVLYSLLIVLYCRYKKWVLYTYRWRVRADFEMEKHCRDCDYYIQASDLEIEKTSGGIYHKLFLNLHDFKILSRRLN